MVFRSAYSKHVRSLSPCGCRFYKEARVVFSPDGNLSLEYMKERDRYAEIQSYKESCDVNNLVKRYENGDQTALLRNHSGVYCDLASMPKNVHEMHQLAHNVESLYQSMGADIKAAFPDSKAFSEAFSNQDKFNEFLGVVSNRKKSIKKENKPNA